jgi:hypothetical protein
MSFNSGLSDALLKAIKAKKGTTPLQYRKKIRFRKGTSGNSRIHPTHITDIIARKTLKPQTYSCLNINTYARTCCSNTCQY